MAQNTFVLDGNIDAVPYGNNLQSAFQALATNNSGATAPSTTYAYQTWYDTTTGLIKQRDASNTTWIVKGTIIGSTVNPGINGFRLSPVTADPLGISASTGNIFFTPYTGDCISLYDNVNLTWRMYSTSELTIALSCATNTNVDIFAYDNGAGSIVFEQLAWTNSTTRATALTRQNGVWVKSGATNRRYIGTYRSIGVNLTQCDETNIFIFNADNQTPRTFRRMDTTGVGQTHSAVLSTRLFKNSTVYQANVITGLTGTLLEASGSCIAVCTAGTIYYLAIGINSTTSGAPQSVARGAGAVNFATSTCELSTRTLSVGLNTISFLESCPAGTVTTSSVTVMGSALSTGMHGTYVC